MTRTLAVLLLACLTHAAAAQGMLLVAKPSIIDPNFRESVIVVTQTPDGAALGVILNKPTRLSLAGILPNNETLKKFTEPLYFGGPVEQGGIFALYQGTEAVGQAYTVVDEVRLALHPESVEKLMDKPPAKLRFFTGYSGWAPGQLRNELDRNDWYVMDADVALLFRGDTTTLWQDLLRRARSVTAGIGWKRPPDGLFRATALSGR